MGATLRRDAGCDFGAREVGERADPEPAGAGEVNEEVRGSGVRHAIGELIACPFCLGQWIGTAFVGGFVFAPRATRLAASVFSVVAVSDALQFGYAALQKGD